MRRRTLLCLALVAFMAVPQVGLAQPAVLPLVKTIDITGNVNTTGGLAYRTNNLWTGDYVYGPSTQGENRSPDLLGFQTFTTDGTILNTYTLPGTVWPGISTGAAFDPRTGVGYLTYFTYSPSTIAPGIVYGKPGAKRVKVLDFQGIEPETRTKGLAHDGRYLWQAHYSPTTGHLYAIDTATNTRVNDLAVAAYPVGVDYDGRYLYVANWDWSTSAASINKYDRTGHLLATYDLPPELADTGIGDIAVNGNSLYVHLPGTNSVAQLQLPTASGSPKPLPNGVRAIGFKNQVTAGVYGVKRSDSQLATSLDDLPNAASLHLIAHQAPLNNIAAAQNNAAVKRRTAAAVKASGISANGGATEVWTESRSWLDGSDQLQNSLHSLAWGLNNLKPLTGDSSVTMVKALDPVPATEFRSAGKRVWASGTLTLNGTILLERDSTEPNPTGLSAFLDVRVVKTTGELCFSGRIGLAGVSNPRPGEDWAKLVYQGDFPWTSIGSGNMGYFPMPALSFSITETPEMAQLSLDMATIPVRVPVNAGRDFSAAFTFTAHSTVPTMAGGLGAEVLTDLGESATLTPGYYPPQDPTGYSDGYGYNYAAYGLSANTVASIPEPLCLTPLVLGLLALRRRSGRSAAQNRR